MGTPVPTRPYDALYGEYIKKNYAFQIFLQHMMHASTQLYSVCATACQRSSLEISWLLADLAVLKLLCIQVENYFWVGERPIFPAFPWLSVRVCERAWSYVGHWARVSLPWS